MVQTPPSCIHIPQQKKDDAAEIRTSPISALINNSQYLLIYTDGSQKGNGSNSTRLVATYGNHQPIEARRNLGRHVEAHDIELFGIPQASAYARQWAVENTSAKAIWIFVDNQAAIPTPSHQDSGQHQGEHPVGSGTRGGSGK